MKSIFKYCFEKWWRPILFWIITIILFGASELINNRIFGNISLVLLFMSLIGLLISVFIQLVEKRWIIGLLSFGLLCGTIFGLFMYVIALFWHEQTIADQWADNLIIPENIEINIPQDISFEGQRPDSIISKIIAHPAFQLYNSFQPGLYQYDFWTGKLDSGIIYLKAFEITQEQPLSTNSLPERSSLEIYNPTDSIMRFGTERHFTIYEGDWGKPYAARFEVWFKPRKDGKERKLFTKNYKIEGWMR